MRKWILPTLFCVSSGLSSAFAKPLGLISGQALETSKPLAGVVAQLDIYKNNFQVAGSRVRTNSQGNYRFPDVQTASEFGYQVKILKDGVPFSSELLRFSSSILNVPDIVVQPVTGELSSLEAEELIMIEFGKKDLLKVTHSIQFKNLSAKLYDYRREGAEPLKAVLPQNGFSLSLGSELSQDTVELMESENQLRFKFRIPPKTSQNSKAEYSYLLPYQGSTVPLSFPLPVRRSRVSLALVGKNVKVDGQSFSFREKRDLNEKLVYIYESTGVAAGQPLKFELRGVPTAKEFGHRVVFIAMGIILLAAFVLFKSPLPSKTRSSKGLRAEKLDRLKVLEDRRRSGEPIEPYEADEIARLREELFELALEMDRKSAA